MLPGSCNGVDLHDPFNNQTIPLGYMRQRLQGNIRAFSPAEFVFRLPEVVGAAELLFDPRNEGAGQVFAACPLGAAVLGAVLCLLTPRADILDVLDQAVVDVFMRGYALQDVLWVLQKRSFGTHRLKALALALFALNEALASRAWEEGGGGWPVFAAMATVSEHLDLQAKLPRLGFPSGLFAGWRAWLDSGDWDPPRALRTMAGKQARGGPLVGACAPAAALAAAVTSPASRALSAAVAWARRCRKAAGFRALFERHLAPIWQSFDRVGSSRSIDVTGDDPYGPSLGLTKAAALFRMSLLPPHIRMSKRSYSSFRFLADRIRARGTPHCNPVFRTLANIAAEVHDDRNVTFVDVGAHLGDCCLWAVARWGPGRVRCIAIEQDREAVMMMRQSVARAGLGDSVQVHQRSIGEDKAACPAQLDESSGGEGSVVGTRLDCFLDSLAFVDIVKVHVVHGLEFSVLAGMLQSLRSGKVGLCMLRTTELQPAHVSGFVRAHGLRYDLRTARGGKDTVLRLVRPDF